jgi:hypothetical protein
MLPDPRTCANFCVIRELLSPAGMQWDPCYPVLFRRKCVGHVFASAVLLPPRNGILEASQTHVCSLMNTFVIRFAIGSATLRLQELFKMFKRTQQIRFPEFKLQPRK